MNVQMMNTHFGGRQRLVRDSEIKQEQGYLGKRDNSILTPGDTQIMIFEDNSEGPFYLSTSKRVARKFDKHSEKTQKENILRQS